MKKNTLIISSFIAVLMTITLVFFAPKDEMASLPKFKFAASIYVGWMPWFLAAEDGTLATTAESYGINIDFVRGDYIETINQFAAGGIDGVVLTNVDAQALLVSSGIKTDVILIGSFSNGNDAILLPQSIQDTNLSGKRLGLVEYSVSHYLLDRYLETQNIPLDSVHKLNVSDSEIAAAFATVGSNLDGVVTWNPIVLQIENQLKGKRLADSSIIEREIADMLVVRRSVMESNPKFAQALLATWFKMTEKMNGANKVDVYKALGQLSGGTAKQYEEQLKTTYLVDSPHKALAQMQDDKMKATMANVKRFVDRYHLVDGQANSEWVGFNSNSQALIRFNEQPLLSYSNSK